MQIQMRGDKLVVSADGNGGAACVSTKDGKAAWYWEDSKGEIHSKVWGGFVFTFADVDRSDVIVDRKGGE